MTAKITLCGRRNVGALRLGRCVAFLAATAFLLPFTILVLVADQQFKLSYNSRRVFYQEDDFKSNTSGFGYADVGDTVSHNNDSSIKNLQYIYDNSSRDDDCCRLPGTRMSEIATRMARRRDHLYNSCHETKLDSSSYKPYTWEYLISNQYHVIWCNVFKAASTSWMYNFNLMANYTSGYLDRTKEVPLELARKKYARPTIDMVRAAQADHAITFIIVRHPLERLASAYKDKIVHAFPRSFHAKMGDRIIQKYRKNKAENKDKVPTFKEFVSYLVDEVRAQRSLDMHWTPYTQFCTPCQIKFDIILKFETLEDDQKYLIHKAHLQDVIKPEWRNTGKGRATITKINQYYSQITRRQLETLYNLYKYDFQLFNYTLDSYYDIVQDG